MDPVRDEGDRQAAHERYTALCRASVPHPTGLVEVAAMGSRGLAQVEHRPSRVGHHVPAPARGSAFISSR
jgi:hypothetical protein